MRLAPRIAKLSQDAWQYASLEQVFEGEFYANLERGLEQVRWEVAQRSFYLQREANLMEYDHYRSLFDPDVRREISGKVGEFFGARVGEDFSVVGHKMVEGDYIGIHTDENAFGERYRLTVMLNHEWTIEDGGVLLSLRGRSLRDTRDAWLPLANTGFLFEIGPDSYHAVSPIKGRNPRFSLILTFKRADQATCRSSRWTLFPLREDVEHARATARHMGISEDVFLGEYESLRFSSGTEFSSRFPDGVDNCPNGFTYRGGSSINVDQNGVQSKGSDESRIAAISTLLRIPPIIMVRRASGRTVLVDGSHRLSFAMDSGGELAVALYNE